jgi:DNA-binding SARP family transcriptional activator
MYFIKIALIVSSAIVFSLSAFSKPNPQLKEQKIKSQLEFVQHLIDRGEAKDALSLLEGLNQEYPEDSTLLEVLSHFYFKSANYPMAAFYFDKLYQVDPSHTPSLLLAAQSYAHMANYPAAINNYKLYLQHHPEDATIWKNLGLLCCHNDDIKGATKAYLKAFSAQYSSLSGEDHLQVAQWFLELENRKRAREFFSYALKEKEVRERALLQLIDLDLKENKFSNAKQKLNILKGLNKNALTLYPIDTIQSLIDEAEALANQEKAVLVQDSSQQNTVLATAIPLDNQTEQAADQNSHDAAPEPEPQAAIPLILPQTLASSFDPNFKFDQPCAKHRALLEPLLMVTAAEAPVDEAEENAEENETPLSHDSSESEGQPADLAPETETPLSEYPPAHENTEIVLLDNTEVALSESDEEDHAMVLSKSVSEGEYTNTSFSDSLQAPEALSPESPEDSLQALNTVAQPAYPQPEEAAAILKDDSQLSQDPPPENPYEDPALAAIPPLNPQDASPELTAASQESHEGHDYPAVAPAEEIPIAEASLTTEESLESTPLAALEAPEHTEPLTLKDYLKAGSALELQEAYSQAIDLYLKAVQAYPKTAELFYRLSRAYFNSDNLAQAEAQAFEAMKQEPHSLTYTFHYLKIAQRTLPAETFIIQLQKAKGRFPEAPELSLALARSYEYHLQNINQALVFYKEFLDQAPLEHPKRQEAEEALRRLL